MADYSITNDVSRKGDFCVAGLLLGAGRAQRMGTAKQLLPWGRSVAGCGDDNQTIIEAAFDGLAAHCNAGMVVVLGGSNCKKINDRLSGRQYEVCVSDPDAEMIVSVCKGLERVIEMGMGSGSSGRCMTHVLIHPADNPVVAAHVVECMLCYSGEQTRLAVIPTYKSKGGHPVLIPLGIVVKILYAYREGKLADEGLRSFWKLYPELVCRREFHDNSEILLDIDTPDDYELALREFFGD